MNLWSLDDFVYSNSKISEPACGGNMAFTPKPMKRVARAAPVCQVVGKNTASTLNPDFIENFSGLGVAGAAREVRCLQINMPCPLYARAMLPKSRNLFGKKKTQPQDSCVQGWSRIKLARQKTCTVAVILRPDAEYCGHYRAVRRRLYEFPPAQGTVADLDLCFQHSMKLDEADRKNEDLHFGRAKLATYIWSRGSMQAGIKQAMNSVSVYAVRFQSPAPPLSVCTMGEGMAEDMMAARPDPEHYRFDWGFGWMRLEDAGSGYHEERSVEAGRNTAAAGVVRNGDNGKVLIGTLLFFRPPDQYFAGIRWTRHTILASVEKTFRESCM